MVIFVFIFFAYTSQIKLPRRDDFFQPQAPPPKTPRQNDFFRLASRIPPSPSAPRLLPDDDYFIEKNIIQNIDENRQNLVDKLEKVIEKSEKKNKKFEVDISISGYFNDAEEILVRNYLQKNENEKEKLNKNKKRI